MKKNTLTPRMRCKSSLKTTSKYKNSINLTPSDFILAIVSAASLQERLMWKTDQMKPNPKTDHQLQNKLWNLHGADEKYMTHATTIWESNSKMKQCALAQRDVAAVKSLSLNAKTSAWTAESTQTFFTKLDENPIIWISNQTPNIPLARTTKKIFVNNNL